MKRNITALAQRSVSYMAALIMGLMIAVSASPLMAQEAKDNTAAPTDAAASPDTALTRSAMQSDEKYRIGAGDVLDIRVFNRPQLSREAVRVESDGFIYMPLLERPIRAACRTESELAKEIATLYLKYQRNPYVNVFIKEYSSTPVAVIGAVEKPGRFQLTRRVRLLELLAFAGGPTLKAGGKIQIAHTGAISLCESPAENSEEIFDFYSLKESMKGSKEANPFIQPGDIVSIPEADQAFVVGNVDKPQPVLLKEPVTVSEAIAMAGGTLRATKMSGIRIVRKVEGSMTKEVILVDLSAINKQKAPDILLLPNDVVEVPTNEGKILRDKIISALTGSLGSVPYLIR
ncbi:MAG: polysaccharide biosynthesis/export family protein [Pyrinomonadaceae bacterium]|nr:polysaccharide biosynthesis/export family protein [Pyrinomonadaceae bacterium]